MTDIVTGSPAVVGFTDGNHHGDHGWSGKDAIFASNIDAGERTRDILQAGRFESATLTLAIKDNAIAIEKTGAANSLAVEKIGAAGILESAKNTAALGLAIEKAAAAGILESAKTSAAAQLFAAQNHAAALAQAAECCCELKELVRAENGQTRDLINANRASDLAVQLADAKNAILALQAKGNGND